MPRHPSNSAAAAPAVAHLYPRISSPEQRKGGGLLRQTADPETLGAVAEFCRRFAFVLGKRVYVDDGVSAFKGLNATPEHELGKFLIDARKGVIRPGDCLLIENYDRLSRQNPWAAIGLVNDLRQLGIHVGRLDRMKLLRCDSEDYGDFFEAAVEFMRGNSESAAKRDRNGAAWTRKRAAARDRGATITRMLPAWVESADGQRRPVPARVAAVRRICELALAGYGTRAIYLRLIRDGVPAFGAREEYTDEQGRRRWRARGGPLGSGRWTRGYVAKILADRRLLGECQPRRIDGTPVGDPIPDYFPAVVTEAEFAAIRAGAGRRRHRPGRPGRRVNVFAGLVRHARDGDSYFLNGSPSKHGPPVLVNRLGTEGRAEAFAFPFDVFEREVLARFREVDPDEVLGGAGGPDVVASLAREHAALDLERAEAVAFMAARGFSRAIGERVVELESRLADLAAGLAAARREAACPLAETWGEAQTLLGALAAAPDPADARVRLRAALRRVVESIHLLVVRRGRSRLAAVQVEFAGGAARHYLILHRPAMFGRPALDVPARSFDEAFPGNRTPDLRVPADVAELERDLTGIDLDRLARTLRPVAGD